MNPLDNITSFSPISESMTRNISRRFPLFIPVETLTSLSADPKNCGDCLTQMWKIIKNFFRDIWYFIKSCFCYRSAYKIPKLHLEKLFGSSEIAAMRTEYWALKENKWMEAIDGEYHYLGKFVFDEALHERTKEPGFVGSMENHAFPLISKYLGRKTSSDFFLEVHKAACWHFAGASNGTLMGHERIGIFRNEEDTIYCNYSSHFPPSDEGWRGFTDSDSGTIAYTDASRSRIHMRYHLMSSAQVRERLDQYLDEFYKEIAGATERDQKIVAIARLSQKMDWLHAVRDGSGRSCVLVLQKHLTEYIGHPGIFNYPVRMTTFSLDMWVEEIKAALSSWEKKLNESH